MIPVEGGRLASLQRTAIHWPVRLKQAAALCNSLNLINKHQMVGDLADQQSFKAVEAQFLVISFLLLVCTFGDSLSSARFATASISSIRIK